MFTGIVAGMGLISAVLPSGKDRQITVTVAPPMLDGGREGDSIAVNGVCLTMLRPERDSFCADISAETLALTTLGSLKTGDAINLEPALRLSDRLGGHLVSGHVDGIGRVVSRQPDGRSERFGFELPEPLARYVARKGSICIDGVSLTVNDVAGNRFSVCLIPHTLEVTNLGGLKTGDPVNIEVDQVARYLERLGEYS